MKKKETKIRKLRLSRETLAELTRPDTRKVEGGGQVSQAGDGSCLTGDGGCCPTYPDP